MNIIIFIKRFFVDVWQGYEYDSDFEYASVLNIPGLWICLGSEYASGTEYVRAMDIPWFYVRVTQGSEYVWICLNNSWMNQNNKIQNNRVSAFVNLWLSPLKQQKVEKTTTTKYINKSLKKHQRYIYRVYHWLGMPRFTPPPPQFPQPPKVTASLKSSL